MVFQTVVSELQFSVVGVDDQTPCCADPFDSTLYSLVSHALATNLSAAGPCVAEKNLRGQHLEC